MERQSHALGFKFLHQIGEAKRCCNVKEKIKLGKVFNTRFGLFNKWKFLEFLEVNIQYFLWALQFVSCCVW